MRCINKRGQFLYKRGQFYLVAGMIIISVIIGFVVAVNYVKKNQTILVDDLREEIKIESQKVLENKIARGGDPINQYGLDYSSHLGSDIEIYFITGDSSSIQVCKYVNGFGEPCIGEADDSLTVDDVNDKIIFELRSVAHEFDLIGTENFYYLITQEIKGEYFVATG